MGISKGHGDDEVPTMQTNALNQAPPNKSNVAASHIADIVVDSDRRAPAIQQPSILNNFAHNNQYGPSRPIQSVQYGQNNNQPYGQHNNQPHGQQYGQQNVPNNHQYGFMNQNSPNSAHSGASNMTQNSSMNAIPEQQSFNGYTNNMQLMDEHGNVHVNKYYNITRNANLSTASKMTDMSEMPSMGGPPSMYNYSNHNGSDRMQIPGHKMSVDSAITVNTNASKILWDDFSDRGSVMTFNTNANSIVGDHV